MDHPDIMRRIAELRVQHLLADTGKRAPLVISTPAITEQRTDEQAQVSAGGRLIGWLAWVLRDETAREPA
jgi:hypothetical protein